MFWFWLNQREFAHSERSATSDLFTMFGRTDGTRRGFRILVSLPPIGAALLAIGSRGSLQPVLWTFAVASALLGAAISLRVQRLWELRKDASSR